MVDPNIRHALISEVYKTSASLSMLVGMVDNRGIELRLSACKADVLPLSLIALARVFRRALGW